MIKFSEFINEKLKKKVIKVTQYGKENIDFTNIKVWLSSDDLISISINPDNDNIISWSADYYSWIDDNIEITLDINGDKIVITSSYNENKDKSSWTTKKGINGIMKEEIIYGNKKEVYNLPINGNTKDVKISIKALIET